ncbi:hypothetical protein QQS21_012578 [Conoideocrella luteorostrata]|uniref:DUF6546 domain-containing protein n=1 Tax=Conoideocrella luteorostrata TaxID=1105319 RepID=A0AAJ0FSC0_9HYPO|nr:hypothetical protein QQS21_012578 [Conoideocrella luteorostrata]
MDAATNLGQLESPSLNIKSYSWVTLPVEIRQMILSLLVLPISSKRYNGLAQPGVAQFATVCREWQVFFESCTFRRLVLDFDSLAEFNAIIRRDDARLRYIRKLWLRVQLSKYECPDCDEPEDQKTIWCNNKIFTACIRSLLETLKLWDPVRHGARGLELMLSASSPSDSEHRLCRYEIKDDFPFHYAEDLDLAPDIPGVDRTHISSGLTHLFHRNSPAPLDNGHFKRAQGTPLRLHVQRGNSGRFVRHKCLPAVPMIKGLVIRRHFRRDIHIATLSRLLDQSFVALEWFRFERTVSIDPQEQINFDRGFQSHLLHSLPDTLRQLSFTQWEIPETERFGLVLRQVASGISQHAQAYLPREMAKLSQRLESFCPPWQMDTAEFLRHIIELHKSSNMRESSLKRITLHCSLSSSDRSMKEFRSLVILTAKAALFLPQLEVVELWGTCLAGPESSAYIFQYLCKGNRASIVWKSSEGAAAVPQQARIIAKWSEVAQKYLHSTSTLAYSFGHIAETREEISASNGTCIYQHLLLKDLVFDAITQIILENEPCGWGLDENSDSLLLQGVHLAPDIANLNSSVGNLPMDILGPDDDLASLQADVMAFEAEVDAFLQQHHGHAV